MARNYDNQISCEREWIRLSKPPRKLIWTRKTYPRKMSQECSLKSVFRLDTSSTHALNATFRCKYNTKRVEWKWEARRKLYGCKHSRASLSHLRNARGAAMDSKDWLQLPARGSALKIEMFIYKLVESWLSRGRIWWMHVVEGYGSVQKKVFKLIEKNFNGIKCCWKIQTFYQKLKKKMSKKSTIWTYLKIFRFLRPFDVIKHVIKFFIFPILVNDFYPRQQIILFIQSTT